MYAQIWWCWGCLYVFLFLFIVIYYFCLFILSSGMEYKTLSQICGSLYLPIFLFRVALLTFIYKASFMTLAMLCPSLFMIWKVSTVQSVWCSNIGEGALKCYLYLSPNVLDNYPMYSSSHSVLSHLNLYMTLLCLLLCPCIWKHQ